jgi:hypothetical protein
MKEEISADNKDLARPLRFLLCDTTCNIGELSSPDEDWVCSPIQCLDKAVEKNPEIIIVRFGKMPFRGREALGEQIASLKPNSRSQRSPVLALLHSTHRKLIEALARAKADYIRHVGDDKLDSNQLQQIVHGLGPDDRLERHLAMVCPFLHYSKVDAQHEIKVCGAYLDRMALGGRRLNELCQTDAHLRCQYFLNFKVKS